ncbi:DNA-directed DNA polymerase [Tanacetum coccineum]
MKAIVFHQMDTEEVSDRFVAPCFVNGLEAYDGEINLGVEENMISNEYAVKLCLEHEVKKGNKVVKKELIVALRGEIYFVKFIINPEEDDVEPGVILERSFLCLTKAITDFGTGTVIIYLEFDPFIEDIEEEEEKSLANWDHLLDFNLDDVPLLGEKELPPFVCKMGKSSRNKKRAMENLNLFYQDIGTSSSAGGYLTQEKAAKRSIGNQNQQKKDKVELDRKIVKEEEEAVKRIKGEALKEKDDPRAFIFPIRLEGQVNENALADTGSDINTMTYRIYEQLGREEMMKVDRGITMINHTQAETIGILTNVLCRVGVTTLIAKFLILDIPIDRDAPIVVGRGFMHTIDGIVNTLEILFLTFDGFCHQTFRAARYDVMRNAESDSDDEEEYKIKRNKFGSSIYGPKLAPYLNYNDPAERSLAIKITMGIHDDEAGSSRSKRSRQHETVEKVLLPQVHHELLLWEGCNKDAKSRMGCDGEIFDMLRIRLQLLHEFYSTYEFDEVYADDKFQTKKIIKFRLGGRAHNFTIDEHFNAQEYWLSISIEENLGLSRSHTSTVRSPILRVIHKMITYGLCQRTTRWMKRKGAGTQKESQIYCGQFISKIARKSRVLTDDVVRSLSALIYCRDLDTTPLRDLIDSEGRLIPDDP